MKKVLSIILIVIINNLSFAESMKAVLFCPRKSNFWKSVAMYTEGAAEDLDIDLKVIFLENNPLKMSVEANNLMEGPDKVDVMIFNNFKNRAHRLIKAAEKKDVKIILFNSPMEEEDQKKMKSPREIYKNWIAEIYPDEYNTGIKILDTMVKVSNKKDDIKIIGLNGQRFSGAATIRGKTLKDYVNNHENIKLYRNINLEDWGKNTSYDRIKILYRIYPETNMIWTASNNMVNGVLRFADDNDLDLGKDIIVGTYNFSEDILELIQENKIAATAGGHEIDGALSLIYAYDYFNGEDFSKDKGVSIYTKMAVVTKDNVDLFIKNLYENPINKEKIKKIDFKKYSKVLSDPKDYEKMSLESMFKQME